MPGIREVIVAAVKEDTRTQGDIASAAKMLPHRLSEYLAGKREIRTDTMEQLLGTLGLEIVVKKGERRGKGRK